MMTIWRTPEKCWQKNWGLRLNFAHSCSLALRTLRQLSNSAVAVPCSWTRPEFLKAVDVEGLSWLICLCNTGKPLKSQTGWWSPFFFRMGAQRVCTSYRGITLLILWKVYARVLERRLPISLTLDFTGLLRFPSWSWNSGPSLYPHGG